MKESFEAIWQKFIENQGNNFSTIKNITFTYSIGEDDSFNPSVPAYHPKASNKENIRKAYEQWPVKGPSFFSKDIFAASYVWGVLNDSRIIKGN